MFLFCSIHILTQSQVTPRHLRKSHRNGFMKFYSPRTATAVIIANMVGSGVFVSLGYQLVDIQSTFPILFLWLLGGIAALTGAMSYAELGAAMPRSGGEYNFLTRVYHPAAGFISGWVSATIGFAAPIAAVAIAFGEYTTRIFPTGEYNLVKPLAMLLVFVAMWFHTRSREQSSWFQTSFTALKIVIILIFCVSALLLVPEPQQLKLTPSAEDLKTIGSPAFAVALIYVAFSYTGWNAATYILGEMENPQKDLPRVLITGTALVTFLYVFLNFVFLKVAPVEAMQGQTEIAFIAAQYAFGDWGGRAVGLMMALLLISSVGAMTLAGPRAIQAIGEDYKLFSYLGQVEENGLPMRAIAIQSMMALTLIMTSSFKTILVFAGGMLAFNSLLAVLGVIILRIREPEMERPYNVPFYPIVPLIFLLITGFTLIYVIIDNPRTALFGAGVIALGLVAYVFCRRYEERHKD